MSNTGFAVTVENRQQFAALRSILAKRVLDALLGGLEEAYAIKDLWDYIPEEPGVNPFFIG